MTAKHDVNDQVNNNEHGSSDAHQKAHKASKDTAPHENMSTENNTIETLKQQLEALKHKSDQNYELALRAKAELDNVRKRTDQEVANAHKYALERFVPELLPLLDGLDQGLQTLPQDTSFDSVRDGLTLSIKMFTDVLSKFGVQILDPVGQSFDPAQHEAISMQPSKEFAPGTVMVVVQKGYVLNNRVLRPARVMVSTS